MLLPLEFCRPAIDALDLAGPANPVFTPMTLVYLLVLGVVATGLSTVAFFYMVLQARSAVCRHDDLRRADAGAWRWGLFDHEAISTQQLAAMAGVLVMVGLVQSGTRDRRRARRAAARKRRPTMVVPPPLGLHPEATCADGSVVASAAERPICSSTRHQRLGRVPYVDASLARRSHREVRQLGHPQGVRPGGQDGEPDQSLDRPARFSPCRTRSRKRRSRRFAADKNGYSVTQGIAELRERLQARVDAELGHADRRVLVTSGTSGALVLAILALVNPGDEVIVFDPYFVMYPALVGMVGGTVRDRRHVSRLSHRSASAWRPRSRRGPS